jgi:hypothetical protein
MARLTLMSAVLFVLSLSAVASAQDFGTAWIDRVTHEILEDEGQLTPRPLDVKATAGLLVSYDDNIFLTDKNRTSSAIFIPFAGVTLNYAKPNFDAEADLIVNYNAYSKDSSFNADEERFFGRARYQGTSITLQLAEVARRENSPTDAVFVNRVSRFLSDTTPLVAVHLSQVFAVEVQSDVQYVKFLRHEFDTADNLNTRTFLTLAYTTDWNAVDLLVQGGYFTIDYHNPSAPPDATGYIARAGLRGQISTNLHVIALAGYTKATSDDFPGTSTDVSTSTADLELHLAYTPNENTTIYADYSRRFGFSAEGAPFQIINSTALIGYFAVRDDLKLRARFQYDRVNDPFGLRRAYYSGGIGAEYRIHPNVILDGAFTYRWGVVPGSGGAGNFGDAILSAGAAVVF